MKFTIAKEVFLDGLSQVVSVVSTRTTLPILSNVMMQTEGTQLRFTATDLDVCITGIVPATIIREGSVTLPAKRLLSIIRELPDEEVQVDVNTNNQATVECCRSQFKLNGLSSEEFPPLPSFDQATEFTVDQEILREGIRRTEYAISTDTTRYVLNGISLSFKEGKLILVATDGRRLAMVENTVEFPETQQMDAILPTKAVTELRRILSDVGTVRIRFTHNQAAFEIGDSLLITKLIDGNYPNYRQVIPADYKERIDIPCDELLDTVRRVSLLSLDKSSNVKLTFSTDQLEVNSLAEGVGEAHEIIAVDYKGRQLSISFNPEFLMAPLRTMQSGTISLYLIDEMSPGVLRADGAFLYVLMPMRSPN
ncbi:MAG: DNA polymerase III subunit beta [Akkermansia sp.]